VAEPTLSSILLLVANMSSQIDFSALLKAHEAYYEGDIVDFRIGVYGPIINEDTPVDFGTATVTFQGTNGRTCTRFGLKQEILKGVDLSGHKFRVSQSHTETDECAVLSGQTSKKWGPSFTLCCSAREYMCTNTDSTDDNIEDHVQQFIHNATDNLRNDDWIQMGPFGLDIVQRVKQNSTS
jgi:hypothetical protein